MAELTLSLIKFVCFLAILTFVTGVGLAVGFILNWSYPQVDLGSAVVAGAVTTCCSLFLWGRFVAHMDQAARDSIAMQQEEDAYEEIAGMPVVHLGLAPEFPRRSKGKRRVK